MSAAGPRRCRSCGALIVWCVTAAGKRMPVDVVPHEAGNLRPPAGAPLTEGVQVEYHTRSLFDDDTEPLYRSHFVSCPDAVTWRNRQATGS